MINARDANFKTAQANNIAEVRKAIELEINNAIKEGEYKCAFTIDAERDTTDAQVISIALEEVTALGYKVTVQWAEPKPDECPSDQWCFSNGLIDISWD